MLTRMSTNTPRPTWSAPAEEVFAALDALPPVLKSAIIYADRQWDPRSALEAVERGVPPEVVAAQIRDRDRRRREGLE